MTRAEATDPHGSASVPRAAPRTPLGSADPGRSASVVATEADGATRPDDATQPDGATQPDDVTRPDGATQPDDAAQPDRAADAALGGSGGSVPAGGPETEPRPEHWARLTALVARVTPRAAELTSTVQARIAAQVRPYREDGPHQDDLAASVRTILTSALEGLARGKGPSLAALTASQALGQRRAEQGLPVDAVIAALRIGEQVLWQALAEEAIGHDDDAAALLATAPEVWGWTRQLSDQVVAAHAEATRAIQARRVGARQRLVELLLAGDHDEPEAPLLARMLGFDPQGRFTATLIDRATAAVSAIQETADREPGRHAIARRGALVWAVSQDGPVDGLATSARPSAPLAAIAVGAERTGLAGARASLLDAELALSVTAPGQTTRFEDRWLWATLAASRGRLQALLDPGITVAREHPHLAEAVRAYALAGFSVSEAARRLGLHANTVGYRLERWTELTGWNPRSFDGLVRSAAALELPGLEVSAGALPAAAEQGDDPGWTVDPAHPRGA